jgi:hypothetical protein
MLQQPDRKTIERELENAHVTCLETDGQDVNAGAAAPGNLSDAAPNLSDQRRDVQPKDLGDQDISGGASAPAGDLSNSAPNAGDLSDHRDRNNFLATGS